MATQILTRKQRGEKIIADDIEEINTNSFFVRSQSGKSGYSVTRTGQSWACDCFDFKYRGLPCKHIFAVQKLLDERAQLSRYKLGL
ncbi:MAG: SWIM zinc finger family protein [Candidatus Bathyarchaeia archaeon]|jgi:hypothetical protein